MRRVGKSFANGWRFRRTSDRLQIRPRPSPKGPSSRTSFSAAAASRITESWDGYCRASAGRDRSDQPPLSGPGGDQLDEDTAAAISAVSQSSTGALRIKMHNKLAALVVLGKYLGMFDERPQNSNVIYAISDEPMSAEEWKKQFVKAG
jgi:hypothetical protein